MTDKFTSEQIKAAQSYVRTYLPPSKREGVWELLDHLATLLSERTAAAGEAIGEVRDNGVTWFGPNPHAFPVGTRFYAAQPVASVNKNS